MNWDRRLFQAHRAPRSSSRSTRVVAAGATIGALAAGLLFTSPAQAAATPAFEIFYGLDCSAGKTASRIYTGANAGEQWISDRFNSTRWGSPGNGQLIRENAASVYVSNGALTINWDRNGAWLGPRTTGACFNLGTTRNSNVNWVLHSL